MPDRQRWQIELADSIRTVEQLEELLQIPNRDQILEVVSNMRLSITPHQRSLIDFTNPHDPLLRMVIPHEQELFVTESELVDPIGDENDMPVPFLTHRYRDRALIYTTFNCAAYCRFCFRKFKTGQATPGPTQEERERIFNYLQTHPEVEEAILSGGDPLTLTDDLIKMWLNELSKIKSIKRIRIHTRTLVNLPSRITASLAEILSNSDKPIVIVSHFNHPRELAQQNIDAINLLTSAEIQIKNQNVLLREVNDNTGTLKTLFTKLVQAGVGLYYIHQLDLARGTNHFRVPIKKGMQLMRELHNELTGIALPRYMLDLPGGKGKIQINKENLCWQGDHWIVKSPLGETVRYNEPDVTET